MKTATIALISTFLGIIAGFSFFLFTVTATSNVGEPTCSLEKAFEEIEIGETAYCKSFKIYRRGDGSIIVYKVEKKTTKKEGKENHGGI